MTISFRARAAAACLSLLCLAPPAWSGVFSVAPVRVFLGPRDRAVAITIANEGSTPLVLETQLNAWSQRPDGTDDLTATDDLVIAPPIITIAAKSQQVVRLALLRAPDPTNQLTYRLLLREVPEAVSPELRGVEIPMALAMNLPVFVSPPAARRLVDCGALQRTNLQISLSCGNTGHAYGQVREASLRQANVELARFQGGIYLLPGAAKRFSLAVIRAEAPIAAGRAEVHVSFDDGQTQVFDVVVP